MNKQEIRDMLLLMHNMTKEVCLNFTNFTEISTYVKNCCPNIEPEYVEVFRDLITPICNRNQSNTKYPNYLIIGDTLFQYIDTLGYGYGFHRPQNLYLHRKAWNAGIDLKTDLYTYEELISKGAKPPFNSEELLKLMIE